MTLAERITAVLSATGYRPVSEAPIPADHDSGPFFRVTEGAGATVAVVWADSTAAERRLVLRKYDIRLNEVGLKAERRDGSLHVSEGADAGLDEILSLAYACTRVWEAWEYGTMTEEDFTPAAETGIRDDLIAWKDAAVRCALEAAQRPGLQARRVERMPDMPRRERQPGEARGLRDPHDHRRVPDPDRRRCFDRRRVGGWRG